MISIQNSIHFDHYTDLSTGVESYLLSSELCPHLSIFHCSVPETTDDGRYFWLRATTAPNGLLPGGCRLAAALDLETDTLILYRDVQLNSDLLLDTQTGNFYWGTCNQILQKSQQPGAVVKRILQVPKDMRLFSGHMATRLTFSPDRSNLYLDISEGDNVTLCSLEIESGILTHWVKLVGGWENVQCDPVHAHQILFTRSPWKEHATGVKHELGRDGQGRPMRLWILWQGGQPVYLPTGEVQSACEHWSADGRFIYYCGPGGCFALRLESGETERITDSPAFHLHENREGTFFCYDQAIGEYFPGGPTSCMFFNRGTGKSVAIIQENPALYRPDFPSTYSVAPAPRFVFGDRWIAHTTTVGGKITVALTETKQLIEKTK